MLNDHYTEPTTVIRTDYDACERWNFFK